MAQAINSRNPRAPTPPPHPPSKPHSHVHRLTLTIHSALFPRGMTSSYTWPLSFRSEGWFKPLSSPCSVAPSLAPNSGLQSFLTDTFPTRIVSFTTYGGSHSRRVMISWQSVGTSLCLGLFWFEIGFSESAQSHCSPLNSIPVKHGISFVGLTSKKEEKMLCLFVSRATYLCSWAVACSVCSLIIELAHFLSLS